MQPVVNPKGHDQQSDADLPDTEGSRPLKAPAKKTAARKSTAKPKPAAKRGTAKAKKPAKIAKPAKAGKAIKKPVKLARKPAKVVKKTAKAAKKPVKVSKPVKAVKKTAKVAKPVKKPARISKPVAVVQPVLAPVEKPAQLVKLASIENAGLLRTIIDQLDDAKAEAIVTISLNGKAALADAMVVASGRSNRHVGAIADQLVEKLKAAGHKNLRIEGMPQCDWVLVDAGDVVVHLFRPEVRSFYNLEKLWSEHAPEDRVAL